MNKTQIWIDPPPHAMSEAAPPDPLNKNVRCLPMTRPQGTLATMVFRFCLVAKPARPLLSCRIEVHDSKSPTEGAKQDKGEGPLNSSGEKRLAVQTNGGSVYERNWRHLSGGSFCYLVFDLVACCGATLASWERADCQHPGTSFGSRSAFRLQEPLIPPRATAPKPFVLGIFSGKWHRRHAEVYPQGKLGRTIRI